MALLHPSSSLLPILRSSSHRHRTHRSLSIRSSALPFPPEKARYHRELAAAVDVVQRACSLCIDVKKSLLSTSGRILEKNDNTPVTVADFGVQALVSLELGRLFPGIPLVAEEDSGFLRSGSGGDFVLDLVVSAVADKESGGEGVLTSDAVLGAIDRGGTGAVSFDVKPATYWVLDPIDGTRGFLKGDDALYVVGLALVVEGKIAIGVMGCPNWKEQLSTESSDNKVGACGPGIIMIAHVESGTWTRCFDAIDYPMRNQGGWKRCLVDSCGLVHEACFCIPDSQTWESLPISAFLSSAVDPDGVGDEQKICLLPVCCGSLCKYLMVASGGASVFILRAKAQILIKVWDHAVGVICVQEAGGQVTDWEGSQLDLAADQVARRIIYPSGGVLVTNEREDQENMVYAFLAPNMEKISADCVCILYVVGRHDLMVICILYTMGIYFYTIIVYVLEFNCMDNCWTIFQFFMYYITFTIVYYNLLFYARHALPGVYALETSASLLVVHYLAMQLI